MPAGYSKRALVDKLGLESGMRAHFAALPREVERELGPLPDGVRRATALRGKFDYVHVFTAKRAELAKLLPKAKRALVPTGMVWVSWPKQSSGVPCDFTETDVRALAIANGLVDVKVCAVTEVWSGLKLVIPLKDRPGKPAR
ncbi:MAG: DUF3052 family protein [Planctomycetes bacterium]|nr:DUF3052 family protein [Planctomycetota bacterium]